MDNYNDKIFETLDKHDHRIRKLEESDIRQQIQLANIEKSQSEIKLMINEQSREQQKTLRDFTETMLTTFTTNIQNDNKTKNNVQFYNTKKFWALLISLTGILSSIVTYFINK